MTSQRWKFNDRILTEIGRDGKVVTYADAYPSGEFFTRISSEIQWEIDAEEGRIVRLDG
jgi:hypothetical protein